MDLIAQLKTDISYQEWEETEGASPDVIAKSLKAKMRRTLRLPGAMDLYTLYERLNDVLRGAPPPEDGFVRGFRQALRIQGRVLRTYLDTSTAASTMDVLAGALSVAYPLHRGRAIPLVFHQAAVAIFQGIEVALRALKMPIAVRYIPGPGRFPGFKSMGGGETQDVPEGVKNLFTPTESVLPKTTTQKTGDLDSLYKDAEKTGEMQLDLMNRGKGMDVQLGAKVIRGDLGENIDLTAPGPVVMIGPLKRKPRVFEKLQESGETPASILDLVRSAIAVDTLEEIPGVMDKLRGMGITLARKPKNRFNDPTPVGYRDIMFNVTYPNGHIGEIQIHLKSMLQAKEKAHSFYEATRTIEARRKVVGDGNVSVDEQNIFEAAQSIQQDLYEDAWDRATAGSSPVRVGSGPVSVRQAKALTVNDIPTDPIPGAKYYEWNDRPAFYVPGKLIQTISVKGKVGYVYDREKFMNEAHEISLGEFKTLLSAISG